MGNVVRLIDMFKNQLALHSCVTNNMIPRERGLNKRQCELFYIHQKQIELQEDGSLVHSVDYHYSVPRMIIESISHVKVHNRANLQVSITKLIRFFLIRGLCFLESLRLLKKSQCLSL